MPLASFRPAPPPPLSAPTRPLRPLSFFRPGVGPAGAPPALGLLRQPPRGPRQPPGPSGPGDAAAPDASGATHEEPQADPLLYCANCLAPVTSEQLRCSVSGSHRHVFANPYGFVFEIGCFEGAPGVAGIGPISTDFSWFAGTAWQTVVCVDCGLHLGWRYDRIEGNFFFGLILDRLQTHHFH